MKRFIQIGLGLLLALAFTTTGLAAGTPTWWDNPGSYSTWKKAITTSTIENTGDTGQYVIVIFDVDNDADTTAHKEVWAQVEWTLNYGTGNLVIGNNSHQIKWTSDSGQCPAGPTVPWDPPDNGMMADEGIFTPEYDYANGRELSYTINPQPACERIEFKFWLGPHSKISYRMEVQTLCFNANAVTLSSLDAHSGMATPTAFALIAIALAGGAGLFVLARRRRA